MNIYYFEINMSLMILINYKKIYYSIYFKDKNVVLFYKQRSNHRVYTILTDGVYLLTVTIKQDTRYVKKDSKFTANLEISMKGPHGYLSATNWPLLHVINFNQVNCT